MNLELQCFPSLNSGHSKMRYYRLQQPNVTRWRFSHP